MARLTLTWLADHDRVPDTALDIATGTGAAALELVRHGVQVSGIDLSNEMLEVARSNAAAGGVHVSFNPGDVRSFSIPTPVELVSCFYDSLNYLLTEQDLLETFRSVHAALIPGGWFVFDINTLLRYSTAWNNATEVAYLDATTLVIYRSTFDPATGISPLTLTVFERESEDGEHWRRWDEQHDERGYPLSDVQGLLTVAGFKDVSIEQLNERMMALEGPASERSNRAVFFCQKPFESERKS
jgi:SAM-dependent methyltransferase